MTPFTPNGGPPPAGPLPADPRLGTPEMEREAAVIAEMRRANRLFEQGRADEACAIWDRFAEGPEPLLEPNRLTWARARARWTLGRLEEAEPLLAALDGEDVLFELRAPAIAARALLLDRLGRRSEALATYRKARSYLREHPQYSAPILIDPIRRWIAAGLAAQGRGPMPQTPDLQQVPR